MMQSPSAGETELEIELARIDIYRHTPIRLLGYANEVGEAFRSMVHVNFVRLSYVISTAYVCADTLDKSQKTYRLPFASSTERRKQVALTAMDTLIWQGFASVIVPGFTINRLCWLSAMALRNSTRIRPLAQKGLVTAIGLAAIPFIVHPIDTGVEAAMDSTLRKLYKLRGATAVE